jgi:hypothetical protein
MTGYHYIKYPRSYIKEAKIRDSLFFDVLACCTRDLAARGEFPLFSPCPVDTEHSV